MIAGVVGVSVAAVRHHTTKPAPTTTVTLPPVVKPFRIVFPEGFTRQQMAERVKVVAKIADRSTAAASGSNERRTSPRRRARSCRASAGRGARTSRGSSSRRPTTSASRRRRAQLVLEQIKTFCRTWRTVDSDVCALEEPDPVRRAEDRLDDREGGRGAGGAAARRGSDLQPAARRGCSSGSTRRSATGCTSRRRSRSPSRSSRARTRTTRGGSSGLPPTPIANPGLASIRAAAHPAQRRLPLLRAQARPQAPLLHRERIGVRAVPGGPPLRPH